VPNSDACPFIDSFGQRCGARRTQGDPFCADHLMVNCSVCGRQAKGNCGKPGPMGGPCGFGLCAKPGCHKAHLDKWHPDIE
jgi:hypothetical protein